MLPKKALCLLVGIGLYAHFAIAASNLFFVKQYTDDFKKSSTQQFSAGDPIYGVINVSPIAMGDNDVVDISSFADNNGEVQIVVYFPDLDKQVTWSLPLNPGLVKKNRFVFAILPATFGPDENHYGEILKVLCGQAGSSVRMQVQVGEDQVTSTIGDILTVNLSGGAGAYLDLYNKLVPASVRNTNTYYDVCESQMQTYVDFNRDEITVTTYTPDSIVFISSDTRYVGTKVPDFTLLSGGQDVYSFLVYPVDDHSFYIYQGPQEFVFYNTNKALKDESNQAKRCNTDALNKMQTELDAYKKVEASADAKADAERAKRDKAALGDFARTAASKRNDPALVKDILNWWNTRNADSPATKVVFLESDFWMIRDEYNQILWKAIPTLILYKDKQGGCHVQWDAFGYEHLGGAAFDTDLKAYIAGYHDYQYYHYTANGVQIIAGSDYDIDCASGK